MIATSGALLGSGALGVSATVGNNGSESVAPTAQSDDTQPADIDPSAISLVAECVDAAREYATFRVENSAGQAVTLANEGTPLYNSGGSGNDGDSGSDGDSGNDDDSGNDGGSGGGNEEAIQKVNSIISGINEKLKNVEPVGTIDSIGPNTASSVQEEIFTQVVAEINAQAQKKIGMDIANPVSTPEEARAEADRIGIEKAANALNNAADKVEKINQIISDANASGGSSKASAASTSDEGSNSDSSGDGGSGSGGNQAAIDEINSIISGINEKLKNVEPVGTIDSIGPNTASNLQEEIFTQVVAEINAQAQEKIGADIANPVSTPEEARAEADRIGIEKAANALNNAADKVEKINQLIADADTGDGSGDTGGDGSNGGSTGGLTVGANSSTEFRTELEPDCTATVTLTLDGETVAEASIDYDEQDSYCGQESAC
ncbi:hypothetical protein [Natrinema caseinilyticum]|uniref:hypothetical protein n=1 Tax=Natrinema caseinilyticum TaxID=2961570 RepID=UPI0020C36DC7|nr:hypothetical protein [Natrinema caseinilyticum]